MAPDASKGGSTLVGRLREIARAMSRRIGDGSFAPWRAANLALGVLACVLAAWVVWLAARPVRAEEGPVGQGTPRLVGRVEVEQGPSVEYKKVLRRKKLFVLPVPTPTGQKIGEVIARAKERIRLRSVIASGDRLGAYFEVTGGGRESGPSFNLYYEGDQVAGFTVKSIDTTSAVVVIAGQEVTFSL